MTKIVDAMMEECAALEVYLKEVRTADWSRPTSFYNWTVADQVMHLHQVDGFGVIALTEPARFPDVVADVRAGQQRGIELSQRMREDWGSLAPDALLTLWVKGWRQLGTFMHRAEPNRRMPWFGPEMGVDSFASARQMEVWAHGQDIYDLFRIRRRNTDRIWAICDLGVRTQGWSFRNRRIDRPAPPQVVLSSPSGAKWVWNDGALERIEGLAEDFAMVVTQRRHVADTSLQVDGEGACAWMEIAQCFAGAAATGPAPGVRKVIYDR